MHTNCQNYALISINNYDSEKSGSKYTMLSAHWAHLALVRSTTDYTSNGSNII